MMKMEKHYNIYLYAAGVIVLILMLNTIVTFLNKPEIVITSPYKSDTVDTKTIVFAGSINPKTAELKVSNHKVRVRNGKFSVNVPLRDSISHIKFAIYDDSGILTNKELTVFRKMSDEEIAEITKKRQVEEAEFAAIDEKRKKLLEAEERQWFSSKAGKIFKSHPNWSKEDCEKLANRQIWIGMHINMVKYLYGGSPDSANPSNYGNGNQWQWCWYEHSPSCFYDENDDGLVDSYN